MKELTPEEIRKKREEFEDRMFYDPLDYLDKVGDYYVLDHLMELERGY